MKEKSERYAECVKCDERFDGEKPIAQFTRDVEIDGEAVTLCVTCDEKRKTNETTHYFATCFGGWVVAATRPEAVKQLLRANDRTVRDSIKANGSFYVWTCRVHAPIDAKYQINFFKPEGVDIDEGKHHEVIKMTVKDLRVLTSDEALDRHSTWSFGPRD
jgi:hypothetical protein